jgi:asparagine synthetase B (glutamine-hydrolysing)
MNGCRLSICIQENSLFKGSAAYVIHNGEIYNHQALRDGILKEHF